MNQLKVTFLRTAGSVASTERGYPAILINDDLLLDCGEGTTQKLIQLGSMNNINTICITHLHCDHYIGLFSLLWHLWIGKRKEDLNIIGPPGIENTVETIVKLVNTPLNMRSCELNYTELKDTDEVQEIRGKYIVKCVKSNHVPITFGYRIEVGEKSVYYTGDTSPIDNLLILAKDCDLLITETTFPDKFSKLAHEIHHSTPLDAGELAARSNSKKLVILHISSYFTDIIQQFKSEAGTIFKKEIIIAKDLMTLEI